MSSTPRSRSARTPRAAERPRRERYHHGDLARELMRGSLQLLSEVGADGLSLREAARRAGVSHRAVYRHYADKQTLLAAIAEAGYRELCSDMQAAVTAAEAAGAEPGDREMFFAIAEAYLRFARRETARFQVMFGPRLNLEQRFPELEKAIEQVVALLMQQLTAAGPHAPPRLRRDMGITLWSALHGLSTLVILERIRLRDKYLRSYLLEVLAPVVDGMLRALQRRDARGR